MGSLVRDGLFFYGSDCREGSLMAQGGPGVEDSDKNHWMHLVSQVPGRLASREVMRSSVHVARRLTHDRDRDPPAV